MDADRPSSPRSPRVLLVYASHGAPPTQPRPWRRVELARGLAASGAIVESLQWVERELSPDERDRCRALPGAGQGGSTREVLDPAEHTLRGRLGRRIAGWWPTLARVWPSLPAGRLGRELRRAARRLRPDLTVVGSLRLAALAAGRWPHGRIVLDLPRLESSSRERLRALGREDASESAGIVEEAGILRRFDAILVSSRRDARRLEALGVEAPCLVLPPVANLPPEPLPSAGMTSPRILFVGSETVANLDAVRWFRRRVLPRVRRAVPSCRLRIVGEAGRHIVAGPDCERVGWIDDLEAELARASVVTLPLRLASGVRRRAVEVLARGRPLATTASLAEDMELTPGRDVIASDDEGRLAEGIIEALTRRAAREVYETRAREIARLRFAAPGVLRPLTEWMAGAGATTTAGEGVAAEEFAVDAGA